MASPRKSVYFHLVSLRLYLAWWGLAAARAGSARWPPAPPLENLASHRHTRPPAQLTGILLLSNLP